MKKRLAAFLCSAALLMTPCVPAAALAASAVRLNPKKPQTLMIWHYYNGIQQQVFNQLTLAFNEGVGAEAGVIVEAHSQGNVNDLTERLLASANREPGAEEMPDLFAAYADTAYQLDQMGLVADLAPYLTQEEIGAYVEAYVREGELGQPGTLKVFPIAKSTELLLLNETDWQPFAEATGASKSLLSTWEGITQLSRMFYEWTDAQTPSLPYDGKAFFGRDAFANYMLIGSLQLGVELFRVEDGRLILQVDDAVMRRLWDNYCVPFVNGWFAAYGRFRSDDVKTGRLSALVGSTSGALYFPDKVTRDDGTTYPIVCEAYPLPNFEGTEPYAVQQGAGMVVTRGTPEQEYAATLFLRWFTQPEQNISFAIHSGYLPVTKGANNCAALNLEIDRQGMPAILKDIMRIGVSTTSGYRLYTNSAFRNGYEARQVVETSMRAAAETAVSQRDALVSGGTSRAAAIALLTGDEAFRSWLATFKAELAAVTR
ncbi:MAG: extracellular solute-binding protein [Clostridiales bacterium]|nr:extracellular solute-binding protein [Clostridiales bacterium]